MTTALETPMSSNAVLSFQIWTDRNRSATPRAQWRSAFGIARRTHTTIPAGENRTASAVAAACRALGVNYNHSIGYTHAWLNVAGYFVRNGHKEQA